MTIIIGFTGTQKGMTGLQYSKVKKLLIKHSPRQVRHGGCIGADMDFDRLACELGIRRSVHPSNIPHKRGLLLKAPEMGIYSPEPPLDRNKVIVYWSDLLIAAPHGKEVLRSGTWATVRYAREIGLPGYIVYPDGLVELFFQNSRK